MLAHVVLTYILTYKYHGGPWADLTFSKVKGRRPWPCCSHLTEFGRHLCRYFHFLAGLVLTGSRSAGLLCLQVGYGKLGSLWSFHPEVFGARQFQESTSSSLSMTCHFSKSLLELSGIPTVLRPSRFYLGTCTPFLLFRNRDLILSSTDIESALP